MKILMTADTVGGVFTYARDLARALRADVVLATMGGPLPEPVEGVDVRPSDFRLEWMADPWADVDAAGEWLRELEAQERPDVVHLNHYAHGGQFRAPTLVVGHSDVASWWQAVHGAEPPPEWDRYRAVVRDGLAGADAVVAPTAAMLSELDRLYGPLPDERRVIPNGSSAGSAAVGKEPFVLAAGRLWDPAKNLAALARAADGVDWPVRVAGPLEGEAPAGVEHLGWLTPARLAEVRACAAIFAHPARYEPFGLAPLEAALDGCALVLGDIPSLREVWGDAAVFVRDERELHGALEALIEDAPRRRELAARARRRARRYTVARMASTYRSLYARMLTAVPA
jgi:glycosyltransferase involved in cell wall biosynthesis